MTQPLLEVKDLKKHYPVTGGLLGRVTGVVKAVDGISFSMDPGITFGLAGESGCGKSTAARAILRLEEPTAGSVRFEGQDILALKGEELRKARVQAQMIFQDPYSSLNPRRPVGRIVAEPLNVHGIGTPAERRQRVAELLDLVGLPVDAAERHPYEFSGGQRQRIGIARALALNPKMIVADEAVSSLDVSIRAQILNLMRDLQDQMGLTYLFIAHDLALVKNMSQRVGIMYLGHIVEQGDSDQVFKTAAHPYTRALLASVPGVRLHRKDADGPAVLGGDVPSPLNPPPGCPFHPRCKYARADCKEPGRLPTQHTLDKGHVVACNYPLV